MRQSVVLTSNFAKSVVNLADVVSSPPSPPSPCKTPPGCTHPWGELLRALSATDLHFLEAQIEALLWPCSLTPTPTLQPSPHLFSSGPRCTRSSSIPELCLLPWKRGQMETRFRYRMTSWRPWLGSWSTDGKAYLNLAMPPTSSRESPFSSILPASAGGCGT